LILSATTLMVFVWALDFYIGKFKVRDILEAVEVDLENGISTTTDALGAARTCAFISLVWSENVRAYTSRSFTEPVYLDMFGNKSMQYAIGFAQLALYVALFTPVLSTQVFELFGTKLGWEGWVAALTGAIGTLILCEVYKLFSRRYDRKLLPVQERGNDTDDDSENTSVTSTDSNKKKIHRSVAHYTTDNTLFAQL